MIPLDEKPKIAQHEVAVARGRGRGAESVNQWA